ncbi:unnamed protein product [Clonostachys solani]|uniref:Uncharacterized protein n=1 Tax=Clonostachys solani TaxID=160281 RepID=A0A9N9ZFL3_9HYPO|nr:unnamed protein product [Clonostachys solani]
MSRTLLSRFTTSSLLRGTCPFAPRSPLQGIRAFTQTARRQEDDAPKTDKPLSRRLLQNLYGNPEAPNAVPTEINSMAALSQSAVFKSMSSSHIDTSALYGNPNVPKTKDVDPYHFHIYATKHNTHITCTKPNREPIISLSAGNLGYRKSRRGGFDPAYSLTKYVIERLIHDGWPMKIKRLEVVLRGFGQGREAAIKVLMSPEGRILREKIVRVADSTRIKFGGTRSKRPRRL